MFARSRTGRTCAGDFVQLRRSLRLFRVFSSRLDDGSLTGSGLRAPPASPHRKMKRLCRKLAVTVAVLVWLGALVYLLVLSRRRLPELGAGAPGGGGGVAGGGETADNQVK